MKSEPLEGKHDVGRDAPSLDEDVQLIRDAVKECVLLTFGYRFQHGENEDGYSFSSPNNGCPMAVAVCRQRGRADRTTLRLPD